MPARGLAATGGAVLFNSGASAWELRPREQGTLGPVRGAPLLADRPG